VRRFGHCPGSGGGMALLREVTFHPELQQLVFTPLPGGRASLVGSTLSL
jgi:hypothetical protein